MNHIVMLLSDPYAHLNQDYDEDEADEDGEKSDYGGDLMVEVDLALSAQANARKYFDQKKQASTKERKTLESGSVAMKSAEKKTKQALKEMAAISSINKARKVYWFEKFFWFISSENFLVIGGRDAQQNEMIVKKYMKATDIYVHADLHGATTAVIKNPTGLPVPPKTLNEAGQFAVCFSAAWDSKVITAAYWVTPDQVSKTAPSGEYLTVGSFMIRGKKNFLPPSDLIMGFGFVFKLEESSVEAHKGERRVRTGLDDAASTVGDAASVVDVESVADTVGEMEIDIEEGDSSDEEEGGKVERLESVQEEEVDDNDKVEEEGEENNDDTPVSESKDEEDENSDESEEDNLEEKYEMKEEDLSVDDKTDAIEFPDTDVKIAFGRSGSVEIKTRTVSITEEPAEVGPVSNNKNNKKQKQQRFEKKQVRKPNQPKQEEDEKKGRSLPAWMEEKKEEQLKRGKKGKMKKIKEKYKDQDEEERNLRMQILQSDGKEKESKKNKKNKKGKGGANVLPYQLNTAPKEKKPPPKPKQPDVPADNEDEEEDKAPVVNDETDMLDTLTGLPLPEDELLFAVPVVAPYSTILNYKYKVKLTPGTGKRGKACKTAIAMFLADKHTIQREKDLLKSVKDQDPARNLPGKVKLSAPHLQKVKGKKK